MVKFTHHATLFHLTGDHMEQEASFGRWLQQRRSALRLTQSQLGDCAGCTAATIRKIEAESRRPSREIAVLLARCLEVAPAEQDAFVRFARGEQQVRLQPLALQHPWQPSPCSTTNLPVHAGLFLGRTQEVASLSSFLRRPNVRMVTLTGPGGVGKTCLALTVAHALIQEFSDGIWFVDLTPISNAALVPSTIAHVLGVREMTGEPLIDTLRVFFRERQCVLLLDNFEQVVTAGPLLSHLLQGAPGLKVVVTSRVGLRLSVEQEYPVLPLTVPEPVVTEQRPPPPGHQTHYAAVELFRLRAEQVKPDFRLTAETAPTVAEICRRLDGLPLAIELAAARSKLFSPQALLSRLDRPLDLLTAGAWDHHPRHQTLRNTLDWSYHLLDAVHQQVFRRLAVFVGGWTLPAAEAVCHDAEDGHIMVDALATLVDASLVMSQPAADGEPRFTMLETIREYCRERLELSGEAEILRRRHAAYFLAVAERAELELWAERQITWLEQLETEHNNLRTALHWALERGDCLVLLRLTAALWRFWLLHGYVAEGRRWLDYALDGSLGVRLPVRARACIGAGSIALDQRDFTQAERWFTQGLTLARELRDADLCTKLLFVQGEVARLQGDYPRAVALFNEARAGAHEQDWLSSAALVSLGTIAHAEQNDDRAQALLVRSLASFRHLGDMAFTAWCLSVLGRVATAQGDIRSAVTCFTEAISLFRTLGQRDGLVSVLEGWAGLAVATEDAWRAARLFGAADAVRTEIHRPLAPCDRPEYERAVAGAHLQIDAKTYATAWAEGHTMTLDQAIQYALDDGMRSSLPIP
jgi:predicted ATPase/transcriptional regulator with XRE-family HTH domain